MQHIETVFACSQSLNTIAQPSPHLTATTTAKWLGYWARHTLWRPPPASFTWTYGLPQVCVPALQPLPPSLSVAGGCGTNAPTIQQCCLATTCARLLLPQAHQSVG